MSLTVASLVSSQIAHWARTLVLSYSSLLAPQAFCNSVFIPHGRSFSPVELSSAASLATRQNRFQYLVTDLFPAFMFFSFILTCTLVSITPNWLFSSNLNSVQVSHGRVILSPTQVVIHVPASSPLKTRCIENLFTCGGHLASLFSCSIPLGGLAILKVYVVLLSILRALLS